MMTQCRACKGEIDLSAKVCPHCGAVRPANPGCLQAMHNIGNALMGFGCLGIIVVIAFVFLAGMCSA